MKTKAGPLFVKQIEDRVVKQIFGVMGNVDDGLERIHLGAFTKTIAERMDRIKVLWQHDRWEPPVGVPLLLKEIGRDELPPELLKKAPEATGALYGEVKYLDTPRGSEILIGIQEKAITENSFMYDEMQATETVVDGMTLRELLELKLWDISPVNWGMNMATVNLKAALPFRDTGTVGEETAWSAPTLADFTDATWDELSDSEKRRIAAHYAWAGSMPPESFGDMKLPHHKAAKSGVGPAVWKGAAAAMGALLGGRGGVTVPEADRKGIYDHLVAHYKQFEKEPPDFKMIEALHYSKTACALFDELKSGAALKAVADGARVESIMQAMQGALTSLEDLLTAAEPHEQPHSALTLGALQLKARSTQLAIALRPR